MGFREATGEVRLAGVLGLGCAGHKDLGDRAGRVGRPQPLQSWEEGASSATYISAVNLADSPPESSYSASWVEWNLGILGKRCSKEGLWQ